MYVKNKYIKAISNAMDFIYHNTDGADEEHNESDTLEVLSELLNKMNESQHNRMVSYYVRKGLKKHK